MARLKLHDNLQFVYEFDLARRELVSMGLDPHFDLYAREFSLNGAAAPDASVLHDLSRRSAYVRGVIHDDFCQVSDYHYLQRLNRTGSVNQYLTHWFYPYKGKFHPQLVRGLMNILCVRAGETVLDPFVGSGTTAVEAQLLGLSCIGVDISPLCCLISRVKTRSWSHINRIDEATSETLPSLQRQAHSLQANIDEGREVPYAALRPPDLLEHLEQPVADFATLAWLIAVSDLTRRNRNFGTALRTNWMRMRHSVSDHANAHANLALGYPETTIIHGDARALSLPNDSVDAVVTSPPYSLALNYVRNDQHALEALGLDVDEVQEEFIGVRGRGMDEKFSLYDSDMQSAVLEMHRVLRPGGKCAIVIGDKTHQGQKIQTSETVQKWLVSSGMSKVDVISKTIFGLYNIMQDEDILIYTKPESRPRGTH